MKIVECKLYLTSAQAETLQSWLGVYCWVYNQALEHRIKAYRRRGKPVSLFSQSAMLTEWRSKIPWLKSVPVEGSRDALRRVDRGMQAFFRRVLSGKKPGFPRFRSRDRYTSMQFLFTSKFIRPGNYISVPKLGLVRCRGGDRRVAGSQKALRIIKRASGWYAQVMIEQAAAVVQPVEVKSSVGIDVGLSAFVTLSTGEKIDNPRWKRVSEKKIRQSQKALSRCRRRSRNRRKALVKLQRLHEKVAAQRKDFCHQLSRRLVNQYDHIAFEKLNIDGMSRGWFGKSIMDVGWGIFLNYLTCKAECAGKRAVAVDPRDTSRTCPECWQVKKKTLGERTHRCECGLVIDRDHAAARVILARSLGVAGAVEGGAAVCRRKVPVKSARGSRAS